VLTTDQKGAIAEAAIALAAIELGIGVSRPLGDERYDLIFDLGREFIRVQCKWAPKCGDVIAVPCRSCRRGPDGFIRRRYSAQDVDAIAAYCPELGRCYFLPLGQFNERTFIQLRLAPTRNNQQRGINWAKEYEFAATLGRHFGAIAQLGERDAGSVEVAGSSPAGSISLDLEAGRGRRAMGESVATSSAREPRARGSA
jgi:PD-(D/E)XK endonuclease